MLNPSKRGRFGGPELFLAVRGSGGQPTSQSYNAYMRPDSEP